MDAKTLIDCVGGDLPGKLMEYMPQRSTCIIYGAMSEKPIGDINPLTIIGKYHKYETFILGPWLQE